MSTQTTQAFTTVEALLEAFLRSRALFPKENIITDIYGEYLGVYIDPVDYKTGRAFFNGFFFTAENQGVTAVLSSPGSHPLLRILEMAQGLAEELDLEQKLRLESKVADFLPVLENWCALKCEFSKASVSDSSIAIYGDGIVDDRVSSSCLTGKCHFYSAPISLVIKPDLGQGFSSTLIDQMADFLAWKALNMGKTTFDAKASGHLKFIDQLA